MSNRHLPALLFVLAGLTAAGCSVDKSFYSDRLYPCDVSSSDSTACGPGYGCYGGARQLGSLDFCAPTCTESSGDVACTADQLALRRCSPVQSGTCPQEMSCIRTNVFAQEGVCLPMRSCGQRTDCADAVRSECLSTVYSTLKTVRPDTQNDHMMCIQAGCAAGGEACSPATTCMQTALNPLRVAIKDLVVSYATTEEEKANAGAGIDAFIEGFGDFCVPNCDAKGNCPPSFTCSDKIFPMWQSKTRFCLPGGNSSVCRSDRDCMVGQCQTDLNVCAAPCSNDEQCAVFNGGDLVYSCVSGHCRNTNGVTCNYLHGCPAGQGCTFDLCLPGLLGFPCLATSECAPNLNLSCMEVPESPYRQCTRTCTTTADCPNFLNLTSHCEKPRNNLLAGRGYCAPGPDTK